MSSALQGSRGLHLAFLLQILSAIVPALLVVLTIPLIRARLDADTFAAFTVLISAVGLLSALDGGLGRASTYFISLALNGGNRPRVAAVFQGILAVGLLLSIVLASTGAIAIHLLGGGAIETARPALFILLAFSPVFVAGSLLRGGLEAQQLFGRLSGLQLLHGSVIGVAPVVLFVFSDDLRWFAWTIGVARVVFALALLRACELVTRGTWHMWRSVRIHAVRVFRYAKWLFLSNLIGLTIVFADRLVVATLFSSALVAAYVLPMELITRLQILITAFCTVLFPRLVARKPVGGAFRGQLLSNAQGAVLCGFLLAAMVLSAFSEPVMLWWIGADGASHAAQVLVVGVVGLGLIACAALAMMDLNSRGLTRPIAWLHAAELPVYLALLYFAARSSSITLLLGVWILRLTVDAIAMSFIASRNARIGQTRKPTEVASSTMSWGITAVSLLILCVLSLKPWPLPMPLRSLVSAIGIAAALLAGGRFVIQLRRSVKLAR